MLRKIFLTLSFMLICAGEITAKDKTVCLNMIVKDESLVIERCLATVKGLIDYWVIVDTGSTDGTQEIIKKYMRGIPGELHERPWKNFAHNRNEALALAKDKADYVLLIDADEVLQFADNFTKPNLDKDFYRITIRSIGGIDGLRKFLLNNHLSWKWEGALHEVVLCPEAKTYENLTTVVDVCNLGNGKRSLDPKKFEKDALVLEEALKEDPNNARHTFYLAQSYANAGTYGLAIKNYEKYIGMKDAIEGEVFWSLYAIGRVQEAQKAPYEAVIKAYFKAMSCHPLRIEPYYRLAAYYRTEGQNLMAYLLAKHALSLPRIETECFSEPWVYEWAMLFEFSNCAYWLGRYDEAQAACIQLLKNPNLPEDIRALVENNQTCAQDLLNHPR